VGGVPVYTGNFVFLNAKLTGITYKASTTLNLDDMLGFKNYGITSAKDAFDPDTLSSTLTCDLYLANNMPGGNV